MTQRNTFKTPLSHSAGTSSGSFSGARPPRGDKHDAGKLRPSLLPKRALERVIRVLEYGAVKYGEENWRFVDNAQRRYLDAALRHLLNVDCETWPNAESNESHIAHAACCLLFMLELQE
jgi:hypothetical protein